MKNLLFISIITLLLQSCAPLATIGMVSLGAASKEKGIGTTLNDNIIRTYNIQHKQILSAIKLREPEKAASLMKEHLEIARLSLTRAAGT